MYWKKVTTCSRGRRNARGICFVVRLLGRVFLWRASWYSLQPCAAVCCAPFFPPSNVAGSRGVFIDRQARQRYGYVGRFSVVFGAFNARPSSQGRPVWRIEDIGDAPVPPSKPAISDTRRLSLCYTWCHPYLHQLLVLASRWHMRYGSRFSDRESAGKSSIGR